MPDTGVLLRFARDTQLLHDIECRNISALKLRYGKAILAYACSLLFRVCVCRSLVFVFVLVLLFVRFSLFFPCCSRTDRICSGPGTPPTMVLVYRLFGPTHAGTFDRHTGEYQLAYPVLCLRVLRCCLLCTSVCLLSQGLSASFTIPTQFTDVVLSHPVPLLPSLPPLFVCMRLTDPVSICY